MGIAPRNESQLLQNQKSLSESDKATWEDVRMALKELEPPSSYFKLTSFISVIGIIALCVFVIFSSFAINPLLFGIISGILISMATVSVTPLYIGVMSGLDGQKSKRKFKEFWAFQNNPSEEVAIVIPRFPIDKLTKRWKNNDLRENSDKMFARKILSYSENSLLVYEDIVASTNIIASFAKEGFSLPQIKYDDAIINRLLDKEKNVEFKTLIVIGFFSNEVTMWLNEKNKCDFKLSESEDKTLKELRLTDCPSVKSKKQNKVENGEEDENQTDFGYGLISKLEVEETPNEKVTIIIVGGLEASQTKLMGRYLKEKWKEIYNWTDQNTGLKVANNLFAGVIGFKPNYAEKGLPRETKKGSLIVKKKQV